MVVQTIPSSSCQHSSLTQSIHIPNHRSASSSTKRPVRPAFKREKSGNHKSKRVSIEDPAPKYLWEYDDMATSFQQFCTMCENQIIVPSNSVLYCSESCRRRDMNKPLSSSMPIASHMQSRPLTPIQSHHSSGHPSPLIGRDIIPQLSPTAITANRTSYTDLLSVASSDLDDDGEASEDGLKRPHHSRHESEAARYLRQFQSPSFQAELISRQARQPNPQSRASTVSLAPSLTNSPSPGTSPSSVTPLSSLPVAYSRPLPSRVNPSASSVGAKSIHLVTPFTGAQSLPRNTSTASLPGLKAQPSVSTNVGADELPNEMPAEELQYEKMSVIGSFPLRDKGNLRSLFRFEQMQAPPS